MGQLVADQNVRDLTLPVMARGCGPGLVRAGTVRLQSVLHRRKLLRRRAAHSACSRTPAISTAVEPFVIGRAHIGQSATRFGVGIAAASTVRIAVLSNSAGIGCGRGRFGSTNASWVPGR